MDADTRGESTAFVAYFRFLTLIQIGGPSTQQKEDLWKKRAQEE